MKIGKTLLTPDLIERFTSQGYWVDTTTNEALERNAREFPDKGALVDHRRCLTYREFYQMVQRLAAHWISLGLTRDDVIAVQLPNWVEYSIVVNSAIMVGIPFCHFHSDFRSKEVEFILDFTGATALVIPKYFRKFDHLAMIQDLRPQLPELKHILVVGDDTPNDMFDLRAFLESEGSLSVSKEELRCLRPHGNDFARVAFTSGTTGDPKAVLHIHNTTNSACRFSNREHAITSDSTILLFLPVGLNWGLMHTVQALLAGCKLVFMDIFNPEKALQLIEGEGVTHFYTAPTGLVAMLNVKDFKHYDLSSLKVVVVGGASCPIEIIRQWRANVPGHLVDYYGMLETGIQSCTRLTDDPEEVCGLVGRPVPEVGSKVVDDEFREVSPGTVGEIASFGPTVTIGYFNNPKANARSFTADGWFLTGDLGVFDKKGYLKIVGRNKDLIIRGGANIYPREIEEVLFKHPKILDVSVIGIPDSYLGERTCACIIPRPGEEITFEDVVDFLRDKIAKYKLPEQVQIVEELPRTPTGKIQKGVLREETMRKLGL